MSDDGYVARMGHLSMCWRGVLIAMHSREELDGRPLHVLEFQLASSWRYCSNGMSEHPRARRIEIYFSTSKECPWAFDS